MPPMTIYPPALWQANIIEWEETYEPLEGDWCQEGVPRQGHDTYVYRGWVCSRPRGHDGHHVAHQPWGSRRGIPKVIWGKGPYGATYCTVIIERWPL